MRSFAVPSRRQGRRTLLHRRRHRARRLGGRTGGGRKAVATHLAPEEPAAAGSSRELRGPAGSHLEMLRRQYGPR